MRILEDPWYIQERLENPSNNTLQAMESMWLQFHEKQAKTPSNALRKTPSSTLPETPKHALSNILGQPIQDLDDKWFQFDDPWFVYDEDEKEAEESIPTKRPRLESKPVEMEQQDELKPPLGILEEFVNLEKAWEGLEQDAVR